MGMRGWVVCDENITCWIRFIDGVLHHFADGVRDYLYSLGRIYDYKNNAPDAHSWSFYDHWGITPEEFLKICHDGVEAGYIFNSNVRPNAVETVNKINELGHTIVIITDRNYGLTPETSHRLTKKWWIDSGFFPYDEIYFSPDKTIAQTDIFVEDKLSNYDDITAAGTECWLINRPWNIENDSRRRIDDISEYYEKVCKKAGK